LYRILSSLYQRGFSPSHQPITQDIPSALLETAARAQACAELRAPQDGEGLRKEAVQCATRLKRERLSQLNIELQYLLQDARRAGDAMLVRQLQSQVVALHRDRRALDSVMPLHG